jgi:hypothetical protein
LSIVLALLWMPLAAHCEIETLLGVELCHHADADHETDAAHTGCDDCSLCQSAKVGLHFGIKLELKPAIFLVLSPWPPPNAGLSARIDAPPDIPSPPGPDAILPNVCLLTSRTSLPVRAPSLVS